MPCARTLIYSATASLARDGRFLCDLASEHFTASLEARSPFDVAIDGYCFTLHEDPEHQAALARKGRPEDWVVLLPVKSILDMQWGDAGERVFLAHKRDLACAIFPAPTAPWRAVEVIHERVGVRMDNVLLDAKKYSCTAL